jgi:Tfp pilus assembly protein PilN
MRAVNLLPRDDARRRREKPALVVLLSVLGAVVLTAILASAFLMEHAKVSEKEQTLSGLRDELAAIPTPPPARTQTEDALVAEKQKRIQALDTALSRRIYWDRVFRELSLVLPDDVWLSNVTAHAPSSPSSPTTSASAAAPAAAAATSGFMINGYTYSHDAVARLMTRLAVVPDLVNVQLQHSTLTKVRDRSIVEFTIAADVRGNGGSS